MRNARFVLLALALVFPASAVAQTVPSPIRYVEETQSVGGFGGYLFTDRGEDALGPHSAPIVGANYTVRFTGPLSGDVLVGFAPSSRTVFQRVTDGEEAVLEEIDETSALLAIAEGALKFNVTGPRAWRGLAPYALGGVGVVADLAEAPASEDELGENQAFSFGPAFAVVVGAGTDWFPSERLAIRVDARDRLWRISTPAGLSATASEETSWTHNISVSLGAALYF